MPITVACPSCQGKLRVADELREQMVRCPSCSVTFFPASGSTSPPPPPAERPSLPPVSDEPLDPEVLDGPDSSAPAGRPRLPDDDEDLRPCPECGRFLHRDSAHCTYCGRISSQGGRSLRRQSRRRDLEPDRGALVLTLGILSLVTVIICAPVGVVLGLVAWVMGHSDLGKMRDKTMEEEGRGMTHAGWICGILGALLNLLLSLTCLGLWIAILASSSPSPTYRNPAFTPAPPPAQRPVPAPGFVPPRPAPAPAPRGAPPRPIRGRR